MNDTRKVPRLPSVKRLPSYLHELKLLRDNQQQMVSTTQLAQRLGLEPIIVRKDLELAGSPGSPGVGYSIQSLIDGIEKFLGWNTETPVFLVGARNILYCFAFFLCICEIFARAKLRSTLRR